MKKAKLSLDDLFKGIADGDPTPQKAVTPPAPVQRDKRSKKVPATNGNGTVPPEPEKAAHPDQRAPVADGKSAASAGYKGIRPPRLEPTVRTLADHPKAHAPGSLSAGDSVWYRDERYYVTFAPETWHDTSFVLISDKPVRPGSYMHRDCVSFMVPADTLTLAPVRKSIFHDQPTKSKIETEARKKELGITDIGDDVGELLRGKSVDQTYKIAAKYLGVPEAELRAKYQHLNPGQQRMTCGNRMRKRKHV